MNFRVFVLSVTLLLPTIALATPPGPVRCEGKIQFRPCPVHPPESLSASRSLPRPRTQPVFAQLRPVAQPTNLFAKVAKTSFQRVGARDGMWRGIVSGNGMVHLKLLIHRPGSGEQFWDIGSIHLKNGKSTNFGFRTVAPPGDRWSWKVVAHATTGKKV